MPCISLRVLVGGSRIVLAPLQQDASVGLVEVAGQELLDVTDVECCRWIGHRERTGWGPQQMPLSGCPLQQD